MKLRSAGDSLPEARYTLSISEYFSASESPQRDAYELGSVGDSLRGAQQSFDHKMPLGL
jgi:hypothetical protein